MTVAKPDVETITVVLVDDSALVRMGFKAGITMESAGQVQVIGEAEDGREALALIENLNPQVVVMDVGMPVMNGIEATRQLRQNRPEQCVIMLTSHESEQEVAEAFQVGASSYCLKETEPKDLVAIIRQSLTGGSWIDPKIARHVMGYLLSKKQASAAKEESKAPALKDAKSAKAAKVDDALPDLDRWVQLSEREMEVLAELCKGSTNAQVANNLCISMNTVKTHIKNIYSKLGVDDRTSAVLLALKEGLVEQA